MLKINKQSGVVSIFVVLFATLLVVIVTLSFARIMIMSQQQASRIDLSQSAYDSAQVGVEDAKRALLRYQNICNSGGDCAAEKAKLISDKCNEALGGLVDVVDATTSDGGEVKVQTGGSNKMNQAYTCVKITLDTPDYLGKLSIDQSNIIPLKGVGPFDTVQVEWFSAKDLSSNDNNQVNLQNVGTPLLAKGASGWVSNKPSVLRTQLIQFGSSFTLSDFDSASSGSNANTLFLYPVGFTGGNPSAPPANNMSFSLDARITPIKAPKPIACYGDLNTTSYSCTSKLSLPLPVNGDASSRTAFLRLTSLYNGTNYRVSLWNGADPVLFSSVQPSIDSTGRANDLFRRVQSRVEFNVNFPYPDAEISTTGNFCKAFRITDDVDEYDSGDCTP